MLYADGMRSHASDQCASALKDTQSPRVRQRTDQPESQVHAVRTVRHSNKQAGLTVREPPYASRGRSRALKDRSAVVMFDTAQTTFPCQFNYVRSYGCGNAIRYP
jgi:hypothetical protein